MIGKYILLNWKVVLAISSIIGYKKLTKWKKISLENKMFLHFISTLSGILLLPPEGFQQVIFNPTWVPAKLPKQACVSAWIPNQA